MDIIEVMATYSGHAVCEAFHQQSNGPTTHLLCIHCDGSPTEQIEFFCPETRKLIRIVANSVKWQEEKNGCPEEAVKARFVL